MRPAIQLINRLNYTSKFALINVLWLIPIVWLFTVVTGQLGDSNDEVSDEIPVMKEMMEKGLMGNKGLKGGFYRFKDPDDSSSRQTLDFSDFTYRDFSYEKLELAVIAEQKNDFTLLLEGDSKYSQYAWDILSNTFCYAASLVPDVNTSLVAIDDAMKLGYNWARPI